MIKVITAPGDAAGLAETVDRSVPPELAGLVRALARVAPERTMTYVQMRRAFEEAASGMTVAEEVTISEVVISGRAAEIVVPRAAVERTTLYLHGGAYTIGSLHTVRALASHFAVAIRSRLVVLDYRLAPEHPHPTALVDALDAFSWMALNFPTDHLLVAGDSAGGGLAIAAALQVTRNGGRGPDAVVAMSPWTDLAMAGSRPMPPDGDPQAPLWLLRRSAEAYLDGLPATTATASPVHADLTRLPPTLLQVGAAEPLLDDALEFAERALDAGAPLRLECWIGMLHVWQAFAPRLEEGAAALAAVDRWLTTVLQKAAGAQV